MRAIVRGIFITLEGVEGCGKTTQARLLAERLKRKGREVVLTREPGGTEIGERIRSILLDSAHRGMAPLAELFLYAAARNQHVREVIQPALARGAAVICDRYADATTAYQGAARGIPHRAIEEIHRIATEGIWPDVTVLLDLPAREGLSRAMARNSSDAAAAREDRFEREGIDFHERVREGYLEIARREPDRVIVVDASRGVEEIQREIAERIESVLASRDCR